MFFDICNAEMAQSLSSLQKSEFLKLIILISHVKKKKITLSKLQFKNCETMSWTAHRKSFW